MTQIALIIADLIGSKGQQRDKPRALDRARQLTLMLRARTGYTAGDYFAAFRYIFLKLVDFLVVYMFDFIYTEMAYLRPALAALAVECVFHCQSTSFY